MFKLSNISVILGLVALGAMTSCSFKEDVNACSKQQVYVDLRAFDYSMDSFATKAADAATVVSQSAGKQPVTISINMLLTSDEQSIPVTFNAYDASGNLITILTLSNVPMKRNRVTTARGTLFNAGGSSTFTLEDTWLASYETTF